MKRTVAWILLLHLLFVCQQVDARWSRSRSTIKPKKGTDIEDIFDSTDYSANTESCESQYVMHEDTIIRTKDSMNAGAVFMKAINDMTAEACKDKCCHTKENGRHCDLAVYQDSDADDDESDLSRCFLFSCIDENGIDSCKTAGREDYVVFRLKKEKISDELLDVLTDFTPNPTELTTKQDLVHPKSCGAQFTVETGFAIQPQESIANGALLLNDSGAATSLSTCLSRCCEIDFKVPNRYCDFVVFREKLKPLPNEKQQRCFLFSCIDENGKFLCSTTPNDDYSVAKRIKPLHKMEIETIENTSSTQEILTSKPFVSTTVKPTITQKMPTSTLLPTTTSPTSTGAVDGDFEKTIECSRLMWQCDNRDCIKVTNVCNGVPNCQDGSDEVGCDVLSDNKMPSKPPKSSTSPIVTEFTPSPSISSSTSTSTSSTKSTTKSTTTQSAKSTYLDQQDSIETINGRTEPQKGAVLPLALGLSVTICVLIMVVCRFQLLKRKTRRRGKPLSMEESDYLINGMYL